PCPEPTHWRCAKSPRSCRFRRVHRLAGSAILYLGMRVQSRGSQQSANSETLKDHCDCGSGLAIDWPPLLRKALDRGLAHYRAVCSRRQDSSKVRIDAQAPGGAEIRKHIGRQQSLHSMQRNDDKLVMKMNWMFILLHFAPFRYDLFPNAL